MKKIFILFTALFHCERAQQRKWIIMGTHLSSRFRIVGRLVFAAVLISMILLFSAGNARATAIGSSNAWINWDTLTIKGIGITFTDITDRFSESYYSVVDNGTPYEDFDDVTDWSSTPMPVLQPQMQK